MPFGQRAGSLKNLKKNLSKSSGGGKGFIKYIPKNSSLNVRFITEPEGWLSFASHFDQVQKRSFPCSTEDDCPGCKLGLDKTNRYLTNVVNLDNNDRVTALEIPVTLANTLVTKYEKWGSITSRDMELSKAGSGLDTTYDLDWSPEDRKRVDKYTALELEEVLQGAFDDFFDESDGDEEEKPKTVKKAAKKVAGSPKRRTAAPEPVDEEDEEEAKPAPRKRATKKSTAAPRKAKEPEFEPDEDEDEDNEPDEPDEVDDDEEGYTVEELEAMTLGQLRKVAREEFGVNTRGLSQADILEAIFAAGEDDDED